MKKPSEHPKWRPPAGTQTLTDPNGVLSESDTQLAGELSGKAATPNARELDAAAVLSLGETFNNGTIIGERYVIERHISSGSFGAVYKARDASIEDHAVALKVLHGASSTRAARHKALRELQLIASVSHPSVVQFKDYGWIGDSLWFTMPWYGGMTLHEKLGNHQKDPLPLERSEAKPIFERLAHGLAAMHEVGVFHHDIKPENIFLANVSGFEAGLPVLLDLGIASKEGEKPVGFTANYVSPETASSAIGLENTDIGAAADVFSIALCLRNALEPASTPKSNGDYFTFLENRATTPVKPPKGRDVRYLAPSFRRWLSLNPSKRPSAKQFADELKLLTAPEDRKRSRMQTVRRLIPVVILAAVLVSVLAFQLTRTEELLNEKEERLEETSEELSIKAMEANLLAHKTEQQQELLESEAARASQNARIAKKLDKELEQTSKAQGKLTSALDELKNMHVDLLAKHDALGAEAESLRTEKSNLELANNTLLSESTTLKDERTELIEINNTLESALQRAKQDHNLLSGEMQNLKKQISTLEKQIEGLKAKLASAKQKKSPKKTPPKNAGQHETEESSENVDPEINTSPPTGESQ